MYHALKKLISCFIPLTGYLVSVNAYCQPSPTLFRSLPPTQTGIFFKNTITENDEYNIFNSVNYEGGGVAIGDINNDGLPDIVFTGNQTGLSLYLNKGNMKFEDITDSAGLRNENGWFRGVNIVDVDGDGWNDIFVCSVGEHIGKRLYVNNHNLTFSDRAEELNVIDKSKTVQSLFFDFDNDGDLDLLLVNSSFTSNKDASFEAKDANFDLKQYKPDADRSVVGEHKLLINKVGYFEDATFSAGMQHRVNFGLSAVACDIDFDGYADVMICNDFIFPDLLYHNNKGKTLENVAPAYFKHTSLFSMGSDYADINQDGIPDIMTVDMLPASHYRTKSKIVPFNYEFYHMFHNKIKAPEYISNSLFLGSTSHSFSEVSNLAGVARTDWSWSVLMKDFDNDGMNDIFVTKGTKREQTDLDFLNIMAENNMPHYSIQTDQLYKNLPTERLPNYYFRNEGNLNFKPCSTAIGLGDSLISNGAAYADLDGDGDLDLVLNNTDTFASVYENKTNKTAAHSIRFKLAGNNKNTAGLGSFVKVYYGDKSAVEYLSSNHGYESSSEPIAHFGLGRVKAIDSMEVFWPGGDYQIFRFLKGDSLYTIHQTIGQKRIYRPREEKQNLLHELVKTAVPISHHENYHVDFKGNRLQPFRLSAEGPGLAVGDVNNDSLEDFYLGSAKGNSAQLFLQRKEGTFQLSDGQPWSRDSSLENQSAVIADFNKDGWNDLLVANGSGENHKDDKGNILKLYLNDRNGNFHDASDLIPAKQMVYSSLAVNDFNNDGFPDVLASGRMSAEGYPLPASSRLLVNHKGHFEDETEMLAPALLQAGNVRSIIWSDYDKDGNVDIVLCGEWMPITFLHNENGKFLKRSLNPVIDSAFGLWTQITQADFDGDGDIDYIVTNYGTNSYLKASAEQPLSLYYDDFDDNGVYEPMVFHYIQDSLSVLYDRNTFCEQMPKNWKKFLTYKSFAKASFSDFISDAKLKTARKFMVDEMRSSYIENLGEGKFRMKPLPADCQMSAMYASQAIDIDGDGDLDIVMVGNGDINHYQYTPMDGSHGVVLLNDGKGNFNSLTAAESGFLNDDYGRDLKVIHSKDGMPILLVGNNNGPLRFFEIPHAGQAK